MKDDDDDDDNDNNNNNNNSNNTQIFSVRRINKRKNMSSKNETFCARLF